MYAKVLLISILYIILDLKMTGDSGKSTILKQMRLIHANEYSESERLKFKPIIVKNIVESISILVDRARMFSLDLNDENEENAERIEESRRRLGDGLDDWNEYVDEYRRCIRAIWADRAIKTCLERRNLFYLHDSIE